MKNHYRVSIMCNGKCIESFVKYNKKEAKQIAQKIVNDHKLNGYECEATIISAFGDYEAAYTVFSGFTEY